MSTHESNSGIQTSGEEGLEWRGHPDAPGHGESLEFEDLPVIRQAVSMDDWRAVIDLARVMVEEAVTKHRNFSDESALAMAGNALSPEGKRRIAAFVAERQLPDGRRELEGMLIGTISTRIFTETVFANNSSFFILPAARGGLTAIRLLHIYHDWARACGADYVNVNVTTGVRLGRTDRLLQRLGFRQMGGNYSLAVKENFTGGLE
jgi:hypothetical protein